MHVPLGFTDLVYTLREHVNLVRHMLCISTRKDSAMKAFLVANPKGGSGKSTLATNLAGYFASSAAATSCLATSTASSLHASG